VRRQFRSKSAGNRDLCMDYMMTRRCKFSNGVSFCKKSHHPRRRSRPLRRGPSPRHWRTMRTPSPRTQADLSAASAVCFEFMKKGTCPCGDKCKYAHGENDKRKGKGRGQANGAAAPPAAPGEVSVNGNSSPTPPLDSGAAGAGNSSSKEAGDSAARQDSPCPRGLPGNS
jgi:hypothetical protein